MPPVVGLVQARLILSPVESETFPVVLRYRVDDPLAVRIAFPGAATLDGEVVEWAFARRLLADGLRAPAGLGDVQIWPHGGRVRLELRSPEGTALVEIARSDAERFLDRSYDAVPAGREDLRLDSDPLLAVLLSES